VLPEPDRSAALRLFDRYESGEILRIAPDLLLAELASLLAKRAQAVRHAAEARLSVAHRRPPAIPR
jgi:predicted nucleic acid-binding protein